MSPLMPLLQLNGVSKRFGALTVADGVTLDLASGEALGVIGPNGAGKTTLFNLISGNLKADAGRITFNGVDMTEMPPARRCLLGLGRTFQIPRPFAGLTVFENLVVSASGGRNARENEVHVGCAGILERTGLLRHANQPAGRLNLLARKRLELARALATNPQLLLLDEIAGGLTEGECAELIETIRGILAAGTTIIWIEHIVHALLAVVGRLAVLDFGRLIADGDPQEVMASDQVREIYLGIEA